MFTTNKRLGRCVFAAVLVTLLLLAGVFRHQGAFGIQTRRPLRGEQTAQQLILMDSRQATPRVAYVFYATSTQYACSSLVNMALLRERHGSRIPIVLLATEGVPKQYAEQARRRFDAHVVTVSPPQPPPGANGYYQDVMTKLLAFSLYKDWDRVVVMDSDQWIQRNPDHLFDLPSVDIAMPRAYWIDKAFGASTLMVIEPSERVWKRVEKRLAHLQHDEYDMDLVNHEFGGEVLMLPGRYATLNSHWENNEIPRWSRRLPTNDGSDVAAATTSNATWVQSTLSQVWEEEVVVLHYTAMGKPWSYSGHVTSGAHPVFQQQFEQWRTIRDDVCP